MKKRHSPNAKSRLLNNLMVDIQGVRNSKTNVDLEKTRSNNNLQIGFEAFANQTKGKSKEDDGVIGFLAADGVAGVEAVEVGETLADEPICALESGQEESDAEFGWEVGSLDRRDSSLSTIGPRVLHGFCDAGVETLNLDTDPTVLVRSDVGRYENESVEGGQSRTRLGFRIAPGPEKESDGSGAVGRKAGSDVLGLGRDLLGIFGLSNLMGQNVNMAREVKKTGDMVALGCGVTVGSMAHDNGAGNDGGSSGIDESWAFGSIGHIRPSDGVGKDELRASGVDEPLGLAGSCDDVDKAGPSGLYKSDSTAGSVSPPLLVGPRCLAISQLRQTR